MDLKKAFSGNGHGKGRIEKIFFSNVNLLPQPRKTFNNIEELSENIAKNGLLNPPIIARFNPQEAQDYLNIINEIWGTTISFAFLRSNQDNKYEILIAGERRLRALKGLWKNGCEGCRNEYGLELPGTCFNRHFSDSLIGVSLWEHISPSQALFFQFSENIHKPVPAAEEAEAYQRLYLLIKKVDPKFSKISFAKSVGRSVHTLNNALKFCDLPDLIQRCAKKPANQGGIPYGIAMQLSRLQRSGESDESLLWWMTRSIISGCKIQKFKKTVDTFLMEKSSGQKDFLSLIMTKEQEEAQKKEFIKKTVAKNTVKEIWAYIAYFKRVLKLFENGQLGMENSAFSSKSPSKVYKELVDLMDKQLFVHMKRVMKRKDSEESREVLLEAQKLSEELKKKFTTG